jgi:DNA transformation protein and related proteins
MPDPKGDKLYVHLSASQVRRRLKGVGYGVRKVHSAGRNMAVVIHTALGHNLRALQAIFADVGSARTERELMEIVEQRLQRENCLMPIQEPLIHDGD